jgi:hypothetical protein
MAEFDPLAHSREKARRYELEADGLRAQRDHLFKVVALLCQVAAHGRNAEPLEILRAVEDQLREEHDCKLCGEPSERGALVP